MPQSLAKVYLHIIFATKNRQELISSEVKPIIQAYIVSLASDLGIYTLEIFANPDHIHWLCTLPRTLTIAEMIQKIKISSSNKMAKISDKEFHWQKGYAVYSVSHSQLETVKKYIQNQAEHHRKMTFQEEYIGFLEKNQIEYDPKYVWD
jgi:REP element-mobilizing transposase RayT